MKYILSIITGIVLGAVLFGFSTISYANPSNFANSSSSGAATTTLTWLTATTNATTTTSVYDTYQRNGSNQTNSGNTLATDSAILKIQVNASSTATKFTIALEYADGTESGTDCSTLPASCAWYADNFSQATSSSPVINITPSNTYVWTFASSTIGGVSNVTGLAGYNGTNNRDQKIINAPTPLRYVRANIIVSGANGGVWTSFIPKKQIY